MGAMTAALIGGQPPEEVLHGGFLEFWPLHDEVRAVRGGFVETQGATRHPRHRLQRRCAGGRAVGGRGCRRLRRRGAAAANLGDDADTTAAIAGQLAGARWGASGIPADWRDKLTEARRIASLARNLAIAGGAQPRLAASGLPAWQDEELVHAWWVQPERVLAGEYPGNRDAVTARAKIAVFVDHGVRTFIDLTTPDDGMTPYDDLLTAAAADRVSIFAGLRVPSPTSR